MGHKKLKKEGKISAKEFSQLSRYKKTNPGLYTMLERKFAKRKSK